LFQPTRERSSSIAGLVATWSAKTQGDHYRYEHEAANHDQDFLATEFHCPKMYNAPSQFVSETLTPELASRRFPEISRNVKVWQLAKNLWNKHAGSCFIPRQKQALA
jgi:hypothetical protein